MIGDYKAHYQAIYKWLSTVLWVFVSIINGAKFTLMVSLLWFQLVLFWLCRMDEMMRGQRGWRELAVLGDKINKFTGMIEGLIWSPRGSDSHVQVDEWAFEEVGVKTKQIIQLIVLVYHQH